MTWATIITGVAIPVLGWILRLCYLSWQQNRERARQLEAANETAQKHKAEAAIYAAPARDKLTIVGRLRSRLPR